MISNKCSETVVTYNTLIKINDYYLMNNILLIIIIIINIGWLYWIQVSHLCQCVYTYLIFKTFINVVYIWKEVSKSIFVQKYRKYF